MNLFQIQEPTEIEETTPTRRVALGIDLGTTNSLVAWVNELGETELLAENSRQEIIPSVVNYQADGSVLVGSTAQAQASSDPMHTVLSIKRIMGKPLEAIEAYRAHYPYDFDEQQNAVPRLKLRGRPRSAVEVSAEILRYLASLAENKGEQLPDGAVITVPAYFDDSQRQATKDAARLAGIKVLRLLNEPTAAAVAYGLDHEAEGVHAIYDLGGGTFDITILRFSRGVFEVISTRGDTELGGDDFDQCIVDWITAQMDFGAACSQVFSCRLRAIAKAAREKLSVQNEVTMEVECPGGQSWQGTLTRAQLEALIDPLIDRTLLTCRRALLDAAIEPEEVRDVVMVGGATRTPRVREQVGELFGCSPKVSIDPDRVVVMGAAIQADQLVGNRRSDSLLLLDVLPLSLGLETMGGLVEQIVPRNTPLPVTRSQEFTTFRDGQTAMSIHAVQGERDLVADNRSLARFELRNIPPMVAGGAKVKVIFQVDADGILNVTAREQQTGIESRIEVKPSYGLTETEIQAMLHDSFAHARDDVNSRKLYEQRVEVDRVLTALRVALKEDGDRLLNADERQAVDDAEQALAELRQPTAAANATQNAPVRDINAEVIALRNGLRRLEKASNTFIMRRMNEAMTQAMTGQNIDQVTLGKKP